MNRLTEAAHKFSKHPDETVRVTLDGATRTLAPKDAVDLSRLDVSGGPQEHTLFFGGTVTVDSAELESLCAQLEAKYG
tara:strand:- start:240 stop:473 length:234 start_codon:yes stop_codon:yes gene_type:complete